MTITFLRAGSHETATALDTAMAFAAKLSPQTKFLLGSAVVVPGLPNFVMIIVPRRFSIFNEQRE